MKTFEEEWTIENLKILRADFDRPNIEYLCQCSLWFESLWITQSSREAIKNLAREFLKSTKFYARVGTYEFVLFITPDVHPREVRLAFLDYEINRLEDKTHED